jgi:nucleoside-diphosphate-sugar epimerase
MKKVTILGSKGQIGAYLTEYLQRNNYEVFEFDILNSPLEDLTHIPNLLLEDKIMNSDFVFFLAFDVGGSRYLSKYQNTFDFINNNTRLMTQTFEILKKYKKPFIFASSQMSNMSYSPYGVLKKVGELYTEALKGLTVKFWNVYGVEHDKEKSHVITDFIRKGFESQDGVIEMLTDGTEERQFLYAEDCCEALEVVMNSYLDFTPNDAIHITSFKSQSIKEIAEIIKGQFNLIGKYDIKFIPACEKDQVQLDLKNPADTYITNWWVPKTNLQDGISKVFNEIKKEYIL